VQFRFRLALGRPAVLVFPWSRGCPLSSAVLYLAIVAIWAVILLPAWIRRPRSARSGSHAATEFAADFAADAETDIEADVEADIHVEVTRHVQISHREQASHWEQAGQQAKAGHRIEVSHSEPVRKVQVTHGPGQNHAEPDSRALGSQYGTDVPDYSDTRISPGARMPPMGSAGPSASRQQMMRARRRMLAILTALTVLTGGMAGLGALPWWFCVPPTGMLVLYLLLLREIAMADAELARKRERALAARAARVVREREQAREAWAESHPEPTAQIIDISTRVGDQLYDQYADATVRAVGD